MYDVRIRIDIGLDVGICIDIDIDIYIDMYTHMYICAFMYSSMHSGPGELELIPVAAFSAGPHAAKAASSARAVIQSRPDKLRLTA